MPCHTLFSPPPPPLHHHHHVDTTKPGTRRPQGKYRRTHITLAPPLIEGCGRWGRHAHPNDEDKRPSPTRALISDDE
jgi:hypothetical protein